MEADTDPANVPGCIGRCPEADQNVHLAHKACSIVCQSEPDLAMADPGFKVVEHEQSFRIHVEVEVAIARAVRTSCDLQTLEQMAALCWPFHDGVLAQRHRRPQRVNNPATGSASTI